MYDFANLKLFQNNVHYSSCFFLCDMYGFVFIYFQSDILFLVSVTAIIRSLTSSLSSKKLLALAILQYSKQLCNLK